MWGDVLTFAAAMIVGSHSKPGDENMTPLCASSNISSNVQRLALSRAMRGSKSDSRGGATCPSFADSTMAAAYTLRSMVVSGAVGPPCMAVDSS
eukprot:2079949-Prymnesium_polylepis.1